MAKQVLILLCLLTVVLGKAQILNAEGLYTDAEGNLFSGTVTKTQDGIKSVFSVSSGVIEGSVDYYYASGNKMEEGTFTKGLKDQKWVRYNENGTTSAIAFYNLGKKTGAWLVFDSKGNKRFEMNYLNGEKTGIWNSWDESGALLSTKDFGKLN